MSYYPQTDPTLQVFQNSEVQDILDSLRSMCSASEYFLEEHWADKITSQPDTERALTALKKFPYYSNYEDLARLEIGAILASEPVLPTKIAFIGSGPLPLTSLCFLNALRSGTLPGGNGGNPLHFVNNRSTPQVLNIDHDRGAIKKASALIDKLGALGEGMSFLLGSAGSESCDLRSFDVVYLAALVGETQTEKEDLLCNVAAKMQEGALIIMRTSWGLRSCLYPVRWSLHHRSVRSLLTRYYS